MTNQNDILKKDILDILSKEISGGGKTRQAFPNAEIPVTDFGLGGKAPAPKKVKAPAKNPQAKAKAPAKPRKPNAWIMHVKEYRKNNDIKGMSVAEVNKKAKETYKKVSGGMSKKAEPSHVMPDGAIHSGATHTKDSKVIKPAPKKVNGGVVKKAKKVKVEKPKKVKVEKAKKAPSKWALFLKDFRKNNPNISGKNVMKDASVAYKKDKPAVDKIDKKDKIEMKDKQIKDKMEMKIEDKLDTTKNKKPDIIVTGKIQNNILADVLDSYDNFNKEFARIANTNMAKSFKQAEFNKIMDRASQFNEKILTTLKKSLDPLSFKRSQDAYDHTRRNFEIGYKNLSSGYDQVEYEDYEDNKEMQNIIEKQLEIPKSVLDTYSGVREASNKRQEDNRERDISQSINLNPKENLPIELQVEIGEDNKYLRPDSPNFNQKETKHDHRLENKFKKDFIDKENKDKKEKVKFDEIYTKKNQKLNINKIGVVVNNKRGGNENNEKLMFDEDSMLKIIDEERHDRDLHYNKRPSNYPYNVLRDEHSIQAPSIDNTNMMSPRFLRVKENNANNSILVSDNKPETKKKPLNLKLYQIHNKLMKQYNPDYTRDEINTIWRRNKDIFIDMLIENVGKYGGNVLNNDHYSNAFENVGGILLHHSKSAGSFGNKFYQASHPIKEFNKSDYDKKNNPYGIGKTHADQPPINIPLPKTENTFRGAPQDEPAEKFKPDWTKGQFVDEEGVDMTDLSDPKSWAKTFENIGKGTYEGLKSVASIFSPLSWLP